jgi:gliding motility-associated peptidyl-prolyl isomerase
MKTKLLLFLFFLGLLSCLNPEPRKPIQRKTSLIDEASIEFNKQLNSKEESLFKLYMKADSLNVYYSSSSGFWYKYNKKTDNIIIPKTGDIIEYIYEISDLDNAIIYSSEELGEFTYAVDKQEIIKGLQFGFKLMHEGDIVTFLFPSHLAYGFIGDQNRIQINQPLIYKVQLLKINVKNESI